MSISPADFMSTVPQGTSGNTAWAQRYAQELRGVITRQAASAPRSLQVHLGPSELGAECSYQVVGKLIGVPRTNHVSDPWPSIVGTAVHAWLALAFETDNRREGLLRWLTELSVAPHPDYPGHADLYDAVEQTITDHKVLGPSSLAKVKSPSGPSRRYQVQLLLYGLGARLMGLPVKRIALAAYPRTASTLDGMFVWSHDCGPDDDLLIAEVLRVTQIRQDIAAEIRKGGMRLKDVPITPDDDECFFCVTGDTQIVTRNGVVPIASLVGGTHQLLVPTIGIKDSLKAIGSFQSAPVMSFGEQKIWVVQMRKGRVNKTVRTTAGHRWILASGKGWASETPGSYETTTAQLRPGDKLRPLRARRPARAEIMPVAIAQGFTFGDGTVGQGRRPATLALYDNSSNGKGEALLPFFPLAQPASYPAYPRDDGKSAGAMRFIYGLPRFWKQLPPLEESRTFLLSWLAGYFAADGHVDESGAPSLSSAVEANIRFARDVAAICGIGYGQVRGAWHTTNYHAGPVQQWSLSLRRKDLPDWFFIIAEHQIRAARASEKPAREAYWAVESVTETRDIEEVYCAVVPGAGAFGLADDLMTGNCPFYRPQSAHDGGPGCPGTIVTAGDIAG